MQAPGVAARAGQGDGLALSPVGDGSAGGGADDEAGDDGSTLGEGGAVGSMLGGAVTTGVGVGPCDGPGDADGAGASVACGVGVGAGPDETT